MNDCTHKMDGSITSYTITYSDAISGQECDSASIPTISCVGRICSHIFEVPLRQDNCNCDINVTVSADKLVQSEPIRISTSL